MGWGWDLFLVIKETNSIKTIKGKENKAFRLGVGKGVVCGGSCSKAGSSGRVKRMHGKGRGLINVAGDYIWPFRNMKGWNPLF